MSILIWTSGRTFFEWQPDLVKPQRKILALPERTADLPYQVGCGGLHNGTGAPDCPRWPKHHHHDNFCWALTTIRYNDRDTRRDQTVGTGRYCSCVMRGVDRLICNSCRERWRWR